MKAKNWFNQGYSFLFLLMLAVLLPLHLNAQTITGKITDAKTSDPIPSVNVIVKGTNSGTFSNKDGTYSINVSSLTDSLDYSFVGYIEKTVPINGRHTINVRLQPKTFKGEETVVVMELKKGRI